MAKGWSKLNHRREMVAAYQERIYRLKCRNQGLISFQVVVKETDLWILAEEDLSRQALDSVLYHRHGLENYLTNNPKTAESLIPLPEDILAPPLMRSMMRAAQVAGTGPMAAVAGALAQAVGRDLLKLSRQVVVENGGDIFMAAENPLTISVWAGESPLSGRIGLEVQPEQMPLSMATSSGTVGHSLSLGRTDAALVTSPDAALADSVATALGNRVRTRDDLDGALNWAAGLPGVEGALLVMGDRLGAWGSLHLVEI